MGKASLHLLTAREVFNSNYHLAYQLFFEVHVFAEVDDLRQCDARPFAGCVQELRNDFSRAPPDFLVPQLLLEPQ